MGTFVANAFDYSDNLRIDISDLSVLSAKFRLCAALCFAEDGGLNTDPRYESYIKYFKANAAKLLDPAMKFLPLLALLCREKLIAAKDVEKFVAAAQKTEDPEKIAMVLDYQNNQLTGKQKETAAKHKEKQGDAVFNRAMARVNKEGISGLNIVVTGKINTFTNRSELKAFIESKGGKLQSSLSAKTDYLIMNDTASDTEKKKKAEELDVEILTEVQFNEKAGGQFVINENGTLTKYRGIGGDVIIPQQVTAIGMGAFEKCSSLTGVTIPEGVSEIGPRAFEQCTGLSSVVIPDSVTTIGWSAFSNCSSLTNVTIGNRVTTIGGTAFFCCEKLTNVAIPASVTTIGSQAFEGCSSLMRIVIPEGMSSIGRRAFAGCKNLTDVVIPAGVKEIGDRVFGECDNLVIRGNVGSYAETYAKENNIPFVAE